MKKLDKVLRLAHSEHLFDNLCLVGLLHAAYANFLQQKSSKNNKFANFKVYHGYHKTKETAVLGSPPSKVALIFEEEQNTVWGEIENDPD